MVFKSAQLVYTGVAGTPWYMNIDFAGTTTSAQASTGLQAFMNQLALNLKSGISLSWDGTIVSRDEATGAAVAFAGVDAYTVIGAYNKEPLPYAIQMLISLNTAGTATNSSTGRVSRIRGRKNIPGLTEEEMTTGVFIPANAAYQGQHFIDLNTAIALVVWSPGGRKVAAVTSIIAHSTPAVLRSRRD